MVTCLDAGSYELVAYFKCGEELETETISVDPVGHNYNKVVTGASCNKSGFTTYKCTKCRYSYVSDYTESLGHNYVEGVCSRCKSVSSDYESLVVSKVNQFLERGNYDEALKVVDNALKLIDSESLKQLHDSIQMAQVEADNAILYTGRLVDFMTYSGSINSSDESNTYSLTASSSGDYRFALSGMVNGFEVKLFVYDSLGYKVGGYSGAGNGDGLTVEMIAGETYTIKISQYSNLGAYDLLIGKQLALQEITGQNSLSGSITYTNQNNEYIFIPSLAGEYKFTLQNMQNGFEVKFFVYDSLGYKVGGYSGARNDSVITAALKVDEQYTIQIVQYNNFGNYEVGISKE